MTLRAMSAFNGTLPVPTDMLIAFIRDPKKYAYLNYTQLVPAPEVQFSWFRLDPDEAIRLSNVNDYGWGYGDYRPTGKNFTMRTEVIADRVQRWDFPYTLDENVQRIWSKQGLNPRQLYDITKASQAGLHRASRVVSALQGASWGANSTDLGTLLGTSGYNWANSSGVQYDSAGVPNPAFQIIKKTLNRVKRRIHLATNGVVGRDDLVLVLSPTVAQAISESGEIFEALKQSPYAKEVGVDLMNNATNARDWNLPESYAGFKIVVEDTPRVYVNQKEDGTIADVTVSSQKDYILGSTDTVYFVSRVGGLDGGYGMKNFSTIQCYTFNGESRVEAFSEPKHQLIEGHVVMEDKVTTPALISGFQLTNVLTA